MAKRPRDPFDVVLTVEQRQTLALWLVQEIEDARAAKSASDVDCDYWHALYEQARTRSAKHIPWPDAADLTSYLPTEKVDAIHARLMRTVWVSPVWTVEGWGASASRAPFVEEFHQWKAEEERLQSVLDKLALTALIEPRALLEISEGTERRVIRKHIMAKPIIREDGGFVLDADARPELERTESGEYVTAGAEEAGVETVVDVSERVRTGPQYRVIPYRDSLILPGHARDEDEIWGYAKRFWAKRSDLVARARRGIYDRDQVDQLTDIGDRETDAALSRSGMAIVPQDRPSAEKELWEALIRVDINAILESRNVPALRGRAFADARWYVLTVHLGQQLLLRVQHDDLEQARYVPFVLFPRPDRATEGFSFIGHKLITTTEEHTAYRNMAADRSALSVSAPILKMQGALWDEDEQPFGPKQVITVRDPREITAMTVPDVPASVYQHIERCERTAERLAGVNDIASGQVAQESRTLGEIQMATEQSFVRMDLVIRRFQEKLEDLGQIRHAIWKRVLAEQTEGVEPPASVLEGLDGRGVAPDQYMPGGKITAGLLEGQFRFKPYGSVETADMRAQRSDLSGFLQSLMLLMQMFPALVPQIQTPQATRALFRHALRIFRVPNTQAMLGSPSADLAQNQALEALPTPAAAPPPDIGAIMQGMVPGMAGGPMASMEAGMSGLDGVSQ